MLRSSFSSITHIAQRRLIQSHALSKASIAELQNRWESMPPSEQNSIVSKLAARQKLPWTQLTEEEKKAAWYISYGEWGPRRPVLAKGEGVFVTKGVIIGLLISFGVFAGVRELARDDPRTMTKEWQLKSNEYLQSVNANPWTGHDQVQSK
ncbi:hypothetical protein TPHA_0F01210 [Tetrapisispora phaffii CBS 4417]|uniref:Cytochrome c oxidase subunit IV n=1 Tax=Tetrapisispora phaffii (strain ATCC 24235 / CBS 4417 / NBRC 1672 / NRRL Y-8282 / UCD 70-5) TaxID=1071381 RepID=G8BV24_TETPH|nr:hypothetical protein TPHA_0F01210 [Tetrapisispora phaffii CBS 4417]CCE63606.1 hypothetical protein TPHA_0F01210 [Tetrapisispora phaffii CBS 4417]